MPPHFDRDGWNLSQWSEFAWHRADLVRARATLSGSSDEGGILGCCWPLSGSMRALAASLQVSSLASPSTYSESYAPAGETSAPGASLKLGSSRLVVGPCILAVHAGPSKPGSFSIAPLSTAFCGESCAVIGQATNLRGPVAQSESFAYRVINSDCAATHSANMKAASVDFSINTCFDALSRRRRDASLAVPAPLDNLGQDRKGNFLRRDRPEIETRRRFHHRKAIL